MIKKISKAEFDKRVEKGVISYRYNTNLFECDICKTKSPHTITGLNGHNFCEICENIFFPDPSDPHRIEDL